MKKLTSIILAAILAASALVSCANPGERPAPSDSADLAAAPADTAKSTDAQTEAVEGVTVNTEALDCLGVTFGELKAKYGAFTEHASFHGGPSFRFGESVVWYGFCPDGTQVELEGAALENTLENNPKLKAPVTIRTANEKARCVNLEMTAGGLFGDFDEIEITALENLAPLIFKEHKEWVPGDQMYSGNGINNEERLIYTNSQGLTAAITIAHPDKNVIKPDDWVSVWVERNEFYEPEVNAEVLGALIRGERDSCTAGELFVFPEWKTLYDDHFCEKPPAGMTAENFDSGVDPHLLIHATGADGASVDLVLTMYECKYIYPECPVTVGK